MDDAIREFHQRVLDKLVSDTYGRPIINNVERGKYVECSILLALRDAFGSAWRLTDAYTSWDIEGPDGVRVEVKQSAALQAWTQKSPSAPTFSIAPKKELWDGDAGTFTTPPEPLRAADVYVFAWHSETDRNVADQRDRHQWRFYLSLQIDLPKDQKSVGKSWLDDNALPTGFDNLAMSIRYLVNRLPSPNHDKEA